MGLTYFFREMAAPETRATTARAAATPTTSLAPVPGLVVVPGVVVVPPTVPTEASEMFHILKNAENPHFYGFRLHTFRTTDKVVRYGINNQFDFAEHPAVIQRGEKRTINICVAVPDVA